MTDQTQADIVEQLRSSRLLSQRNQIALQGEAATEIERLRNEVERLDYDSIHTCHDKCRRLPCVQSREIERLRAREAELQRKLDEAMSFPAKRKGGAPNDEMEHFMQCGECGQYFDMRDLVEVLRHEEPGHEANVAEMVRSVSADIALFAACCAVSEAHEPNWSGIKAKAEEWVSDLRASLRYERAEPAAARVRATLSKIAGGGNG